MRFSSFQIIQCNEVYFISTFTVPITANSGNSLSNFIRTLPFIVMTIKLIAITKIIIFS